MSKIKKYKVMRRHKSGNTMYKKGDVREINERLYNALNHLLEPIEPSENQALNGPSETKENISENETDLSDEDKTDKKLKNEPNEESENETNLSSKDKTEELNENEMDLFPQNETDNNSQTKTDKSLKDNTDNTSQNETDNSDEDETDKKSENTTDKSADNETDNNSQNKTDEKLKDETDSSLQNDTDKKLENEPELFYCRKNCDRGFDTERGRTTHERHCEE